MSHFGTQWRQIWTSWTKKNYFL